MQQMHGEAPRLEDHVVAVIELVDVHGYPWNGRHNRGADRGIGDHAVLLAVALGCDGDDRGCEIAQELVCQAGLKHTSRYMTTSASLPTRVLGRTKARVPVLGFGLAPLGSDRTSFAEAERIVRGAIDLGVTYLDVSPDYGDAEAKLKAPLQGRRERVFLVTKVNPNAPDALVFHLLEECA